MEGFDAQVMAVGENGDEALAIGAENGGVMIGQTVEDVAVGVAVTVVEAGGDQRESGAGGIQEVVGGGSAAAVVRHLEDIGEGDFIFGEHLAFDGALDVAGEQERAGAVADAEDQGVVVVRRVDGDVIGEWGEDVEFGTAEREVSGGDEGDDLDAVAGGAITESEPGGV